MKKLNRNNKYSHDPYEDIVRLEELDAYEALITYKKNKKFINIMSF